MNRHDTSTHAPSLLRNRFLQTILLSSVLLQIGIWVRNFAILLYVADRTNNDPYAISLISVAEFAPILFFVHRRYICGPLEAKANDDLVRFIIRGIGIRSATDHSLRFMAIRLPCRIHLGYSFAVLAPSSMRLFKYHVSEEQLRRDGFIPIADGHLHGPWPYAGHIRLQHVWP